MKNKLTQVLLLLVLVAIPSQSFAIQIIVTSVSPTRHTIEIPNDHPTFEMLYHACSAEFKVPINDFILIFRGHILRKNDSKITTHDIHDGSIIHLMLRRAKTDEPTKAVAPAITSEALVGLGSFDINNLVQVEAEITKTFKVNYNTLVITPFKDKKIISQTKPKPLATLVDLASFDINNLVQVEAELTKTFNVDYNTLVITPFENKKILCGENPKTTADSEHWDWGEHGELD